MVWILADLPLRSRGLAQSLGTLPVDPLLVEADRAMSRLTAGSLHEAARILREQADLLEGYARSLLWLERQATAIGSLFRQEKGNEPKPVHPCPGTAARAAGAIIGEAVRRGCWTGLGSYGGDRGGEGGAS